MENIKVSITRQVVDHALGMNYKSISELAVKKTKELILDDIGNALGGSALESSRIIIEWGKLQGTTPESTIISDGKKTAAWAAAGVNAQLSMALDFMETYKNLGHPGSGMVMAAMAIGEREAVDGKELITAICNAYDVTGRIIDATSPSQEHRAKVWNESWHVCGPLFTAVRLLKLNREQAMNALGMGLGNAPTLNVHNILYIPGSMSKASNHFHCFTGINAAILAKLGYTGYHEILDEPYGYWTTVSDMNRKEIYTKSLGEDFLITNAMALKPWPTCRWAQAGIESLLEIMKAENLYHQDIEKVIYRSHEKVTSYPYDSIDPQTPEDAYWSVPWAFGNAALGYNQGPLWYIKERFKDDTLKKFMNKVNIETLPEAVEAFAKEPEKSLTLLEVKTAEGKTHSRRTEYCKGDPKKPMTHEEIINKFLKQTDGIISKEKASKLIDHVERLEKLENISKIARAFF
jgi:2-methylcitrate dehydratase PrpD